MAIASVTEASYEPASISVGPVKFQFVEVVANSGATSGTVTASRLKDIFHILVPGIKSHTAAPTYATNVATLAFTVPAETKAALTFDGLTYTAATNLGKSGNNVTINIIDGSGDTIPVTNGNEVVSVSGNNVAVRIDPTAVTGSTRTNVRIALNAATGVSALMVVTGTSATVAAVKAKTNLAGGIDGGFRGTALCIGRGNGASS